MPLPQVTLTGNLTADPELRYTQSGKGVVNLRVASSERKKTEAGEWVDGDTTFLNVTSWNNAEAIANQLKKGNRVTITGVLKQRDYETKTGERQTAYEVNADSVAIAIRDQVTTAPAASNTMPAVTTWNDETPF